MVALGMGEDYTYLSVGIKTNIWNVVRDYSWSSKAVVVGSSLGYFTSLVLSR